mgnify:CR=1 FL=1
MDNLINYLNDIKNLEYTLNLLNWELRVNAPVESKDDLIEVIGSLDEKLFKLNTSNEYESLLKNVIENEFGNLSEIEKRYINDLYKDLVKFKKIPSEFFVNYQKYLNKSNVMWEKAKDNNDYEMFKPYLKKVINLTKEYYGYISDGKNLYDTMLNEFESGITSEVIDKLFNELKNALIPIMPGKKNKKKLSIKYNESELVDTAKYLLNYIGFDNNRGTLGIYPHGFTEKIGNNDVRIAFKKTNNALDFVSTIIHEGGHGILEQNVNSNLTKYECMTCEGINALHESQSRFFENMLGRNINFWIPIYDKVKEILGLDVDINEFVKGLNSPVASLVRTEADELTYCMHIILRYEIERDLFSGKINVDDLPNVWNQKMKEYLGVEVINDKDGVMQDVHWAEGDFGYFPSYLIGSIFDGMFLEIIENDLGSIDEILKSGNIKVITKYLIENIYANGAAFTGREVLEKLGRSNLSVVPLVNYFYKKYGNKNY